MQPFTSAAPARLVLPSSNSTRKFRTVRMLRIAQRRVNARAVPVRCVRVPRGHCQEPASESISACSPLQPAAREVALSTPTTAAASRRPPRHPSPHGALQSRSSRVERGWSLPSREPSPTSRVHGSRFGEPRMTARIWTEERSGTGEPVCSARVRGKVLGCLRTREGSPGLSLAGLESSAPQPGFWKGGPSGAMRLRPRAQCQGNANPAFACAVALAAPACPDPPSGMVWARSRKNRPSAESRVRDPARTRW